jgi:hypothetical protein
MKFCSSNLSSDESLSPVRLTTVAEDDPASLRGTTDSSVGEENPSVRRRIADGPAVEDDPLIRCKRIYNF